METFKVEGGAALDAALLDLSKIVARRLGREALAGAAEPILEAYKAGTKSVTGHLVESETAGTRLNKRQRRLTPRPGPDELVIHIGTADPAGIQEEFGMRQAAHPALTPAWDSQGGQVAINRIGKSLGEGIERAAARARKR